MKKKYEVRHIVTAVASIPVYKINGKTEAYKLATKDGWGTVYRDENNALVCDEDNSASLYTKNGGYFGIFPYEEINVKEMPKQAACAAIITTDSCGVNFWAEDFNQIHIFVTYEESGLVDTFRVEYGEDVQPYDGETEIAFEDLVAAEAWEEAYRAEIPGTVEYQRKQEAAELAAQAAASAGQRETWMDEAQQKDFREICGMIDTIKSGRDFYRVMDQINGGGYSVDVINAAREFKKCFNSAQYEPGAPSAGTLVAVAADMMERATAAPVERDAAPALAYVDDLGVARCGECGAELLCSGTGDMPDVCQGCGRRLEYDFFREPDGPDMDRYRTRADNQQGAGTAAEAASEGRETALGTPETMAGTDATAEEKRRKKRKKKPP